MSEKGKEAGRSEDEVLDREDLEEEDEAAELSPDADEKLKAEWSEKLAKFYQVIKRLNVADRQAGWMPKDLENESKKLAPIIQEMRHVLEAGGAVNPDDLISFLIEFAKDEATKHFKVEDFLMHVFDYKAMKAQGLKVKKFYQKMVRGLESAQDQPLAA